MTVKFSALYFLVTITLLSCEKNVTLSQKMNRYVASEQLKIDSNDTLPDGLKDFLTIEQNLGSIDSNTKSIYSPENNPKFPLPYYLVPEEDANFMFSDSLNTEVADQLIMKISGKKHYKFFIHPEAESFYDFLRSSYSYIGTDRTEFFATPTSSYQSLIVWNRNNGERRPFAIKLNENKMDNSIINQKFFNHIGKKKLDIMNIKIFQASALFGIEKIAPDTLQKIPPLLISEIPETIIRGEKKWLSFLALMNSKKNTSPLIIEVIKKSGFSSYDFFKNYMVDGYLNMLEELSLKNGINFVPNSQNLFFETTNDLKPTGFWVLKNIGEISPDIITMAKNKGPVSIYMNSASASKYKLRAGRIGVIGNYALVYKEQIFGAILNEVAKNDSSLTAEQIETLKNTIDNKYTTIINKHLGLKLKAAPNIKNYKFIEEELFNETELDEKIAKKEMEENDKLKFFIENKMARGEWVSLSVKKTKSKFYITDYGLYEISNKKIISFALFNRSELEEYNTNNKMLLMDELNKTGCYAPINEFLRE